MPTDAEYAAAARALPPAAWRDDNGSIVLPRANERVNNINVGRHLMKAAQRGTDQLPFGYLGLQTAQVVAENGLGHYLEKSRLADKWHLRTDTPRRLGHRTPAPRLDESNQLASLRDENSQWAELGSGMSAAWPIQEAAAARWAVGQQWEQAPGTPSAAGSSEPQPTAQGPSQGPVESMLGSGLSAERAAQVEAARWAARQQWEQAPGTPPARGSSEAQSTAQQPAQRLGKRRK